jgi:hypothetical protein
MRRGVLCVLAVLALVFLAEHRLSDGQPRGRSDPPREIWGPVYHSNAVMDATSAATCTLVLSLDSASTYTFTSADEGVRFDIDADGVLEQVAWTAAGSDVAFLAIDQNADGRITSGKELITRYSAPQANSAPNALLAHASEASLGGRYRLLDTGHPLFPRLLLWRDTNHNGSSEPSELRPAAQLVRNIGLGFQRHHRRDPHGNESRYRGFVHIRPELPFGNPPIREDDVRYRRWMYDACLVTR